MTGVVISTLAHAIALVQGQWRAWSRGGRLFADLLAAFVFLRLPLQLLEHRPALVEAGLPGGAATWLVASAAVGGVIVAGGVGYSWWRALQRGAPGGAEAGMRVAAVI